MSEEQKMEEQVRDYDGNSIYGNYKESLRAYGLVMEAKVGEVIREAGNGFEHISQRLKSEESMRDKCRRKGVEETTENALHIVHDAIGLRIVCRFMDEVQKAAEILRHYGREGRCFQVVEEKDYITNVKPNGYRSYHMVLKVEKEQARALMADQRSGEGPLPEFPALFYVEVQLRTIAMDTWAALEHEMKYKKDIQGAELISKELKRCADELASCDVSMQTIRDLIR